MSSLIADSTDADADVASAKLPESGPRAAKRALSAHYVLRGAEKRSVKPPIASSTDLVAEGYSEHARSKRRLFHDEIVSAGEGGCVRVGQILTVQHRVPGIFGDSDRSG